MHALVLERRGELSLRDIALAEPLGRHDVRITVHTVGVCASDVHYYQHGQIGQFVVRQPMILGHEASGVVAEIGEGVTTLAVGDRVCMEPGIPDPNSRASRLGMYNLDPAVRFWATPPVHGVLRPSVVHPEAFTYRLPPGISMAEGAMVEPLAVGMHAVNKARVRPGDLAVVIGAGPIGVLNALAALAGGCSRVILSDVQQPKLDLAAALGQAIIPVNSAHENLVEQVMAHSDGWGADVVFECSGNVHAAASVHDLVCPGGCVVFVGLPSAPVPYDISAMGVKETRVEHVFRYAHVYPRALALIGSGKLNVMPLITETFAFADGAAAFDYARHMPPRSVKVQITVHPDQEKRA